MMFSSRVGYFVVIFTFGCALVIQDTKAREKQKLDEYVVVLKNGGSPEEVAIMLLADSQ